LFGIVAALIVTLLILYAYNFANQFKIIIILLSITAFSSISNMNEPLTKIILSLEVNNQMIAYLAKVSLSFDSFISSMTLMIIIFTLSVISIIYLLLVYATFYTLHNLQSF